MLIDQPSVFFFFVVIASYYSYIVLVDWERKKDNRLRSSGYTLAEETS